MPAKSWPIPNPKLRPSLGRIVGCVFWAPVGGCFWVGAGSPWDQCGGLLWGRLGAAHGRCGARCGGGAVGGSRWRMLRSHLGVSKWSRCGGRGGVCMCWVHLGPLRGRSVGSHCGVRLHVLIAVVLPSPRCGVFRPWMYAGCVAGALVCSDVVAALSRLTVGLQLRSHSAVCAHTSALLGGGRPWDRAPVLMPTVATLWGAYASPLGWGCRFVLPPPQASGSIAYLMSGVPIFCPSRLRVIVCCSPDWGDFWVGVWSMWGRFAVGLGAN